MEVFHIKRKHAKKPVSHLCFYRFFYLCKTELITTFHLSLLMVITVAHL